MVDRPRPRGHAREDDRAAGVGEELVVVACALPALLVPLRQMTKLHEQEPRLDGVEAAVVPFEIVEVLPRLTVVPQHPAAPRQLIVVRGDRAGFAAGPQVLAGIEAERGGVPHRSGPAPAVLL